MLNTNETLINVTPQESARITGKLSEIIYACAADKEQVIVLSNLPDDGNQLVAEAIHDLSSWADRPFFFVSCHGQTGRNVRVSLTYPVYAELVDLFTNPELLEPMQGGTVLINDPYHLSAYQQEYLQKIFTQLSLKLIINIKSFNREIPQHLSFPLMKDAKTVRVPSLRNHSNDIRFAANYFLSKANLEWNKNIPGVSEECLEQMLVYPWPGQLPQLRETIRQAAFLAPAEQLLTLSALPAQIRDFKATDRDFLKEAVKQAEYEMIYKTLRETNNNKRKTAEILKISRKTLYSKINMYKMNNFSPAIG